MITEIIYFPKLCSRCKLPLRWDRYGQSYCVEATCATIAAANFIAGK